MDTKFITRFCLYEDILKAIQHCEDVQIQMNDAEVMTTALAAALFLGGNYSLEGDFS